MGKDSTQSAWYTMWRLDFRHFTIPYQDFLSFWGVKTVLSNLRIIYEDKHSAEEKLPKFKISLKWGYSNLIVCILTNLLIDLICTRKSNSSGGKLFSYYSQVVLATHDCSLITCIKTCPLERNFHLINWMFFLIHQCNLNIAALFDRESALFESRTCYPGKKYI